jgi:hypothetical protein
MLNSSSTSKAQRPLGGAGSGGVGVEIDDDVLGKSPEQFRLDLGEGRARTGDHVVKSGGVDGDAIHLAFDQDGVFELADRFFGVVEIEEHARLGVDRRLGGVQIFRPGLLVGGERAGGEGDDFALVVADREHDAIAEFGVDGGAELSALAALGSFASATILSGAKDFS